MMFKGITLCDFCFEPVAEGKGCENCGLTHENYIADSKYLKLGTNLLGKYIIDRILGRGSFGATYLAYSSERDKVVAIKEYCPSWIADRAGNEEKLVITSENNRNLFEKGAIQFFDESRSSVPTSGFLPCKKFIRLYYHFGVYTKSRIYGGADIFLDYFMLLIQDYVCTLPGSYSPVTA